MGQDTGERFFMVVVDDSEELHQALYFACGRAKNTGGRIAMVYVIPPAEFAHWAGVGELMREEAREKAEESIRREAEIVEELTGKSPLVFIREGKPVDEIIALMKEEPNIRLLVLGADTKADTAGPLVSYLTGKGAAICPVPITIVPGNLTDEQIDHLI
ncbi:MAG: universal stress protein [Candidatus Puniceispirillaceae bacterium]